MKSDGRHSFLEFGAKSAKKFIKNSQKNAKFDDENEKTEIQIFNREKMLAIFDENIVIRERCKGVHCVDLGESFPTSIYLQKSASIQPRTSPLKFGRKFNSIFNRVLSPRSQIGSTCMQLLRQNCGQMCAKERSSVGSPRRTPTRTRRKRSTSSACSRPRSQSSASASS